MKSKKKILSLLLVLAMVFTLAVPAFADPAEPVSLATWTGGTSVTNNGTGDVLTGAVLTVGAVEKDSTLSNQKISTSTYGNLSATPWYGTDYYADGTQYAFVAFSLSTKGYENLSLKTVLGGNARVPTGYKLMYSLDNTAWTAVEGAITATAKNTLAEAATSTVAIPAAAANQATVYFRLAQTVGATPKTEGGTGSNAGSLYIYSLALTGTAVSVTPPPVLEMAGKTVILHSNDVHGAIANYAAMAALKADYEAKGATVILADAGDYSQGTAYVSTTKGMDAIEMMNATGYDVATLGNHEFDYGYEQLKTNMAAANFKVLCADVLGADGKTIYDGNTIIEKNGVKIGFFGLETPEAQTKANPALIKGLTFLAGDELYACAKEQVAALKADGADIIICLSHLGTDSSSEPNRSTDLLAKVEGIDFLIDGHSHSVITADLAKGEITQSTGSSFKNIGVIVIDNATKAIESNKLVEVTTDSAKDETVAAAAKVIIDRVDAEYGEVFAKSEVELNGDKAPGNRNMETNLGDLITDAMVWQVKQNLDGVTVDEANIVAITNGGGIRAWIHAGDITKKDVNTVLPFGNTIAVVYVTGAELLEALEASTYCTPASVGAFAQVSGIEYTLTTAATFDKNAETYPGSTYYGPASINRVVINSINGNDFDMDATYAVVTNNFCAAGGDTYYAFASATSQFDTGIPLDEALMAYITTELKGVVGSEYAEPQGRINIQMFSDIADSGHKDNIEVAYDAGFVTGYNNGTYGPNESVTRAQFITMLWRAAGKPEASEDFTMTFTDVAKDSYYYDAVAWGAEQGIIKGYSDTMFGPQDAINRQQMATFLYRFLTLDSVWGPAPDDVKVSAGFKDEADVSPSMLEAINVMANCEYIMGHTDGTFRPLEPATRGQVATILVRIFSAMPTEAAA